MSKQDRLKEYFLAATIAEIFAHQQELDQSYIKRADTIAQLSGILPLDAPPSVFDWVFEQLRETDIFLEIEDEFAGNFFKLRPGECSAFIETANKDPGSLIYKYRAVGPQFLAAAVNQLSDNETAETERLQLESTTEVPASDRVVRLNHNQIDEIEGRATEIVQELEHENSVDGEDGLRELILGKLRAGRELIKAGIFSLESLRLTMVVGLQMLVEKYKDHAIGAAAGNLLSLLLKEFGL